MLKRIKTILTISIVAALAYLLLWPVPIDPVAWDAPKSEGYVEDFTPNDALKAIRRVDIGKYSGPEDIAVGEDNLIYMSTHDGVILRLDHETMVVEEFANTQGRPLGIEFGSDGYLYVADAYRGLLKIGADGNVTVLATETDDGSPIHYADDLDVAADGFVYFTDASVKFGAEESGGTLPASLLDIIEHGGNGRVLKYDPHTKQTKTIHQGLNFANGLALTEGGAHMLVVETGSYAVHKIPVDGTGESKIIVENLPGFPDNINRNADGTFWVGLASPRSDPVDMLSSYPFLRKIVQRLPAFIRPKPERYGFVIRINEKGKVLETLQDSSGNYAFTTGAVEGPNGSLYISSLTEPDAAVLDR